jgi:hypothetical protein
LELAEVDGLRAWRMTGCTLTWLYFEQSDHLNVIRFLGERQDILVLLGADHQPPLCLQSAASTEVPLHGQS